MIQLDVLNGTKAGTRWVARRFPFRIGREKDAALCLTDDGIWESHFDLTVRPDEGCILSARSESFTLVNGEPVSAAVRLRNGDRIEAGSVALQFGLSPTRSSTSSLPEILVWLSMGAICLAQLALIYFVLP